MEERGFKIFKITRIYSKQIGEKMYLNTAGVTPAREESNEQRNLQHHKDWYHEYPNRLIKDKDRILQIPICMECAIFI